MELFSSALAILGQGVSVAANVAGLHSWMSGFHTGGQISRIQQLVEAHHVKIEKLAERLLYADLPEVQLVQGRADHVRRLSELQSILSPIQRALDDDILSTAVIATPERLRVQFGKDPWEVLIGVTPLHRARRPPQSAATMVPVVFQDGGFHVGWQTKGMLEIVTGTSYEPVTARRSAPSGVAQGERDQFGVYADVAVPDSNATFRLRLIEPGTFMMGSPDDEKGRYDYEGPQHQVTLTQGFWPAETPCTQAVYATVMGTNPSRSKGADRPVERVSWDDAQEFLQRFNERLPGSAFMLPTEAQWEYACRAGTTTARYGELDAIAWYGRNAGGRMHPVMQKQPNAWGLYDTLGNVYEWTGDWFAGYSHTAQQDPQGPSMGGHRVIRGGSWSATPGTAGPRTAIASRPTSGTTTSVFVLSEVRLHPEVARRADRKKGRRSGAVGDRAERPCPEAEATRRATGWDGWKSGCSSATDAATAAGQRMPSTRRFVIGCRRTKSSWTSIAFRWGSTSLSTSMVGSVNAMSCWS